MTTVLVTGGTGLTGSFVVAELARRGNDVRVVARTPVPGAVAGDLRDPESLARAAAGASAIVHVACTFTDSAIDIAAMHALLAAWDRGPFVFVSSLDVYGLAPGTITEDTPLSETYNDYASGKVACERALFAAAAARGRRDVVSLRAPYIWGPHPTARRRVRGLVERDPIVLPGATPAEWQRYRDAWIDVRDFAAIIAACVERPPGEPLNVLAGHYVWHDLYTELLRLTGRPGPIVHRDLADITDAELPNKQNYAQTWEFTTARLTAHLGPLRHRALADSLADTIGAFGA